MKKFFTYVVVIVMLLSLVSCGGHRRRRRPTGRNPKGVVRENTDKNPRSSTTDNNSVKILEDDDTNDINSTIPSLNSQDHNNDSDTSSGEIRPEFKEAMNDYEAFYDEYCTLMAKYMENPTDAGLSAQYGEMTTKLSEMDEMFTSWGQNNLNATEWEYYLEVSERVLDKILEVTE